MLNYFTVTGPLEPDTLTEVPVLAVGPGPRSITLALASGRLGGC